MPSVQAIVGFARVAIPLLQVAVLAFNALFLFYTERARRGDCECAPVLRAYIQALLVLLIVSGSLTLCFWVVPSVLLHGALLAVFIAFVVLARVFIDRIRSDECQSRCGAVRDPSLLWALGAVNLVQLAGVAALGALLVAGGAGDAVRRLTR
jgi:hypothetical protein